MTTFQFLLFGAGDSSSPMKAFDPSSVRSYLRSSPLYPPDTIKAKAEGSCRFEGIITSQREEPVEIYSTTQSPTSRLRLVRELDNTVELSTVTDTDRSIAKNFWHKAKITGWATFFGSSIATGGLLWKGYSMSNEKNTSKQVTNLCWVSAAVLGATALLSLARTSRAGNEEELWDDPLPQVVQRRQAIGLPTTGYEEIFKTRGYGVIAAPNEVRFTFHAALDELKRISSSIQDTDVLASISYAGLEGAVAALDQRYKFVKQFVKTCPLEPQKLEYAKLDGQERSDLLNLGGRYREVTSQLTQLRRLKDLEVKNARLEAEIKRESAAKISAIVGGAVGSVVNTACATRAREDYDMRMREENKKFDNELAASASRGAEAVRQTRIEHEEREREIKIRFDKRLTECGAGATNLATLALVAGQVSKEAIDNDMKSKSKSINLSFKANITTELLPKVRSILDDYEKLRKQN